MQVTSGRVTGGNVLKEMTQVLSNIRKPVAETAENGVKETASEEASKGLSSLVKGGLAAAAAVAAVAVGLAVYDTVQKKKTEEKIKNLTEKLESEFKDKGIKLYEEKNVIEENVFPKRTFFIDEISYDTVSDNKTEQSVKEKDIASIKRESSEKLKNMIAEVDEFNKTAALVKEKYGIDLWKLKTKINEET